MPTLLFAVVWFALTFVVHIVWWRVRRPTRQTSALLKFFLGMLPVGLVAAWIVPELRRTVLTDLWDYVVIAQFHIACSLAYACINSAIQEDSPALMVTTFVKLAGPKGCTFEEVRSALDDDLMIQPRLAEFESGGMIELVDGRYRLTVRGRKFRILLAAIRAVYRLPRGG